MNVIFLDFDGVLNSVRSCLAFKTFNIFDPVSVRLVNRLCKAADARIVVSSSWRIGHTTASLKERMIECGAELIADSVIDMTPRFAKTRGHEIAAWMNQHQHEVHRWLILDDDSDMLAGQPLVQTSGQEGLTFAKYVEAVRILAPEHRDAQREFLENVAHHGTLEAPADYGADDTGAAEV